MTLTTCSKVTEPSSTATSDKDDYQRLINFGRAGGYVAALPGSRELDLARGLSSSFHAVRSLAHHDDILAPLYRRARLMAAKARKFA
jgi:hypothetical protein